MYSKNADISRYCRKKKGSLIDETRCAWDVLKSCIIPLALHLGFGGYQYTIDITRTLYYSNKQDDHLPNLYGDDHYQRSGRPFTIQICKTRCS